MRSKSTTAALLAMTGRTHSTARGRVSRGPLVATIAAAAAAGVLAGCASGGGSTSAASNGAGGTQQGGAGTTISSRQLSGVGMVLTDQSGKTLYTPEQEANGTIKCTGSCLSFWFPVTAANGGTPHAGSTLAGKLGSIKRPDGTSQVTYNGEPLYTFKLDSGPGQAHGNDFTDSFDGQSFVWHAATASGTAPAPAPSSNPASGYNYQGGGGY
jgi:predicted lipoprotein with Yx(FWY)xxD motif